MIAPEFTIRVRVHRSRRQLALLAALPKAAVVAMAGGFLLAVLASA